MPNTVEFHSIDLIATDFQKAISIMEKNSNESAKALASLLNKTKAISEFAGVRVSKKGGDPAQTLKKIVLGRLEAITAIEHDKGERYSCQNARSKSAFRFAVTASENLPWFNTSEAELGKLLETDTAVMVIWNPTSTEARSKQIVVFCLPIGKIKDNYGRNSDPIIVAQIRTTLNKLERKTKQVPGLETLVLNDPIVQLFLTESDKHSLAKTSLRIAGLVEQYIDKLPEDSSDFDVGAAKYVARKLRERLFQILLHIQPKNGSRSTPFELEHQKTTTSVFAIPSSYVVKLKLSSWESKSLQKSYEEYADSIEDDEGDPTEIIQSPYDPTKTKIDIRPMTISLLAERIREKEIDLAPPFQRKPNLWSNHQKSQLVESMLIKIPLPAFYFDATDDSNWLVVDGLQRLSTLKAFLFDGMKLSGLEYLTQYNGLTFEELPRPLKRAIGEAQVTVHLIQPGTPPEVKFNIFRRVNTGGLTLSAQEIRHALNQGPVVSLLNKLASSKEFLDTTGGRIPTDRMADREFVLRYLAFAFVPYTEYKVSDMDAFLSVQMSKLNESPSTYQKLSRSFRQAMLLANKVFGRHAFRKMFARDQQRYPINKALFETWSVAFGKLTKRQFRVVASNGGNILDEAIRLNNENDFLQSISQGTADVSRVQLRFRLVGELVDKAINDYA